MRITMLGTSGSGKTCFMNAMTELFVQNSIGGFKLRNKERDVQGEGNIITSTLGGSDSFERGMFPLGTNDTTVYDLELRNGVSHVVDITWLDYRGGAIVDIARNQGEVADAMELHVALLASDVILVFVDSALLKLCMDKGNDLTVRRLTGAVVIEPLLEEIKEKNPDAVVFFLLSKYDSSFIDKTEAVFEEMRDYVIQKLYREHFKTKSFLSARTEVFPIGVVGFNNVETTVNPDSSITQRIKNGNDHQSINIIKAFTSALLCCLEKKLNQSETDITRIAAELELYKKNFTIIQRLMDLIFRRGRDTKKEKTLKEQLEETQKDILNMRFFRPQLVEILNQQGDKLFMEDKLY